MKRSCLLYLLALPTLSIASAATPLAPAFPGAEGAGSSATGGRGGSVYHVTNLNATGPGSFADAVSAPNRTVVFDVSGIIDLAREGKKGGHVQVTAPNITIAGQTAPGEGICLRGGTLQISASNVIVRYLRSRRGFVRDQDTGDSIEVKPVATGVQAAAGGQTDAAFDKRKAKKESRGKVLNEFAPLSQIVIDHCSASWSTDENLTVTHTDRSTVSWCIAAEGLDYTNAKQTPPNHSEGSLWGSGAPNGRSTMHHMLYAHNRLRNPRTTGGTDKPPVLNFYNNAVYDWSEYASHTGSERVLLNWLNSYYKAGPDTPEAIRFNMFQFHGDPGARIYAAGNYIFGSPANTADNKLAIGHNEKFKNVSLADREAMKVGTPFPDAPATPSSAEEAFAAILSESGATLPARDSVDLRIAQSVRAGTGHIIQKETDLPEDQRWPHYRSLPPPKDTDGDGIPDFWETQFALNPADPADGAKLNATGYSNLEHYLNNIDPTGADQPIISVVATISRAHSGQDGEWRLTRTGDSSKPATVHYHLSGDAVAGQDYEAIGTSVPIPAGASVATVSIKALPTAKSARMLVLTLDPSAGMAAGCPAQSLIVIGE